ncbi:MAG TPA: hypothetical protein VK760_14600 [Candidatus Acidoferrales bacterium]|jgi:hypothetical protein|nr:hypothetical protein [Candidatus Acidoferrales bacterium]
MKRLFASLLCLALLAGCARAHPESSASATPGAPLFYPSGVEPPGDWAAQQHDGIYSSDTAAQCCFLAGRARLTLDNPPGAQLAVFKFYVPAVKPLAGGELVTASFNGVTAGKPALLPAGMHDVIFTIPPSLRSKAHLSASLVMSVKWVPKQIGQNADERELSIMLLRVGYI